MVDFDWVELAKCRMHGNGEMWFAEFCEFIEAGFSWCTVLIQMFE